MFVQHLDGHDFEPGLRRYDMRVSVCSMLTDRAGLSLGSQRSEGRIKSAGTREPTGGCGNQERFGV